MTFNINKLARLTEFSIKLASLGSVIIVGLTGKMSFDVASIHHAYTHSWSAQMLLDFSSSGFK